MLLLRGSIDSISIIIIFRINRTQLYGQRNRSNFLIHNASTSTSTISYAIRSLTYGIN